VSLESAIEYAVLHARGHEGETETARKVQTPQMKANAKSPLSALFGDLPSLDELERRYLLHVQRPLVAIAPGPLRLWALIAERSTE